MYKLKITEEQANALRRGDKQLLVTLLEQADKNVTRDLKNNKDDVRFLQGASHIIDGLLKYLG